MSSHGSDELRTPPQLARLWRLPSPERRGRPARLTLDLVVRCAVELADAGGLEAVTIPKVARAAGCSTMALYRHVSSKDELLVLMTDLAAGMPPVELGRHTENPWRAGLQAWAEALYSVVSAHPWIPHVPIGGPPSGPSHMAWLDAALHLLDDAPLSLAAKVATTTLIAGHVHQAVRLAAGAAATPDAPSSDGMEDRGKALARLVTSSQFRHASAIFTDPSFATQPADDDDFHFGLGLILDGVESRMGD